MPLDLASNISFEIEITQIGITQHEDRPYWFIIFLEKLQEAAIFKHALKKSEKSRLTQVLELIKQKTECGTGEESLHSVTFKH